MITHFFSLSLTAIAWIAALWLLIRVNFSSWPHPGVIALHALPPLVAWLLWLALRHHVQRKKRAAAHAEEARAQAERDAARDAARQKHEDNLRQRRFSCDCRAIAMTGLGSDTDMPLLREEIMNVDMTQNLLSPASETANEPLLDRMTPAIAEALSALYTSCRASTLFPVFILPPADTSGEAVLARIRAIHAEMLETLDAGIKPQPGWPSIRFLPSGDGTANSILSLFDTMPDLPGAVILAFDSPLGRAAQKDDLDDEESAEVARRVQQLGTPNEAAVALLLTNAALPSMLPAIGEDDRNDIDGMTPFWQRGQEADGNLAMLVAANAELRRELAHLPILGRIHRAACAQSANARAGVMEMTQVMQSTLEHAQVNAGLIDMPFVLAPTPADSTEEERKEQNASCCSGIVHNAGGVDVAGKRLAALGSALYYFGIDLSPVDVEEAINIVTRIGDLGGATGVAQLAIGLALAAQRGDPVLCVDYGVDGGIAASFVMHSPSAGEPLPE